MVLPVFKIGRSPLTRGGWVRLPGASATNQSDVNSATTCSVSDKSVNTTSAPAARSSSIEWLPVATAIDRAPPACAHATSSGVSPITTELDAGDRGSAAFGNARERPRQQPVAIGSVIPECAAGEVAPEIEVFELDPCRLLVVAREEREVHIVARGEPVEQFAHARHDTFARAGPLQLVCQPREVGTSEGGERCGGRWNAVSRSGVGENPRVGAPGHMDARERVADRKDIIERERHRAGACPAREHKRPIDVEKQDCGRDRRAVACLQPSLRTLPARGPFADGSSSKLTRWPSLIWSKLPWTELR